MTVTDGDGDKATSSTGIGDAVQFQDDGPTIGPIANGLVDFAALDSVTNPLNGIVGVDDPATFKVTSSPATLTILDGTSGELTLERSISLNDTVVTYFNDVNNNDTVDAGEAFFKLTLSGGNYTFDVLKDPPPAEVAFNFTGAPSGSNLFMTFGDPTTAQIVVVGQDPLNQSQGGNINTQTCSISVKPKAPPPSASTATRSTPMRVHSSPTSRARTRTSSCQIWTRTRPMSKPTSPSTSLMQRRRPLPSTRRIRAKDPSPSRSRPSPPPRNRG